MPYKEIKLAIQSMDESKITLDTISAFIRFAPTKEEIHTLLAYPEKSKLGNPEKFYLEVSIKNYPNIPEIIPEKVK